MHRLFSFFAAAALITLLAPAARADLIGGPDIIPAPSSVIDDAPGATNTHQQAFNERQDVLLLSAINVDAASPAGSSIAAGTWVDSHMIFLNTSGTTAASDTQTWAFNTLILGVMSDYHGNLEVATSPLLGAPGTTYPAAGFNARGFESNDWWSVVGGGYALRVQMSVTEPGDWIRVITAASPVPEPASLALLAAAAAFVAWRRRRRAAA